MGKLAETEPQSGKPRTCHIATIRAHPDLDAADRAAIDAQIASANSHRGVARWLTANGPMRCGDGSVSLHRSGECACGKR